MRKYTIAALFLGALSFSACHYGVDEAKGSLERNEQYKGDKADYSVNRAGEGGKMNSEVKEEAPAPAADTTAHAEAPAAETHH